jgi:hypothetical protein
MSAPWLELVGFIGLWSCLSLLPATPAQSSSSILTSTYPGLVQQCLLVTLGHYPMDALPPHLPPASLGPDHSCLVHPSITMSKPQREIHNSRILKGKEVPPARWPWQFWQLGKGMCLRPGPLGPDLLKHIPLFSHWLPHFSVWHPHVQGHIHLSGL